MKTSRGIGTMFFPAYNYTVVIYNFKSGTYVYNLKTQIENLLRQFDHSDIKS